MREIVRQESEKRGSKSMLFKEVTCLKRSWRKARHVNKRVRHGALKSYQKCLTLIVTFEMSHSKCLTQMSLSKCLTSIVSLKMSHLKCLIQNVSLKMSHLKCLIQNVSFKMFHLNVLFKMFHKNVSLKVSQSKCLTYLTTFWFLVSKSRGLRKIQMRHFCDFKTLWSSIRSSIRDSRKVES